MLPSKRDFTEKEWRIIEQHRSPAQIQRYLTRLAYNFETENKTCRSFRGVLRHGSAHCLEAAIAAAAILEQHGRPPLLMSMESKDRLDHVVFVFKERGRFGAVGRSRQIGLHGRRPVFRNVRALAMSYFDSFIDKTGRITGYALADLRDLGDYDWRLSPRNVWKVERYLQEIPHREIRTSDARYEKWRRRYIEFSARYPDRQPVYYPDRRSWML